jgi:Ca-activated chloride channel family protein
MWRTSLENPVVTKSEKNFLKFCEVSEIWKNGQIRLRQAHLDSEHHNHKKGRNKMRRESGITSSTGEAVSLKSVHIEGQLDGLMLSTVIQQHYHNETGKDLEIVYTFPLAYGATLMGMNVAIDEKRLQAVVIEKKEAEQKYEDSINDGDMPVMVEQSSSGLYTANLGNIKDGEKLTIEIRYAQLLRFEQGQIRLSIPTVIAPRYGDAHQQGGLAPHESDVVDLSAKYPLTIRMDLLGQIAKANISSPSHKISTQAIEGGISAVLESGAMLDRDFILTLNGLAGQSFAVLAPDGEEHTMLASFCPELPVKAEPLSLKILVDCSGSMRGGSIASAKHALRCVLQELQPQDCISYSRFGSSVQHESKRLKVCSPDTIRQLSLAIDRTDADMGGTEMQSALISTFNDILPAAGKLPPPSVLLITDGEVWDVDGVIRSSLASEQRVFVVGVSMSPAESLLRDLAEKTGGACELVSPNEDIAAAILRMFHRMRGAKSVDLQVEWGKEPVWQSPLPAYLYDGETLHLFARFSEAPDRVPELTWNSSERQHSAKPETLGQSTNQDIARLGGAKQMLHTDTPEDALDLALKYQLVSGHSNLFLVHVREGEKAEGLPSLQHVPQMLAAGWGGLNSLSISTYCCSIAMCASVAGITQDAVVNVKMDAIKELGKKKVSVIATDTPKEVLQSFNNMALANTDFTEAVRRIAASAGNAELQEFVARTAATEGIAPELVWALVLDWLIERFKDDFTPCRQAQRLLRAQLRGMDTAEQSAATRDIAAYFGSITPDTWAVKYGKACSL